MQHCCKVLSTKEEGQQRFSVLGMRAPVPEIPDEKFYNLLLNDMRPKSAIPFSAL
jgi:hypothetical protein